jgi:SAM-dependent methyltransferase
MRAAPAWWYERNYVVRDLALDTRLRSYYAWALDHVAPGSRTLDVGCGQGTFVSLATRRGHEAHGIDFSEESVDAGRRVHGLPTLRAASLDELLVEGAADSFDAATAFEVVEHVEDPVGFVARVGALVRPGGLVLLSVPNRDRWPLHEFGDAPPNHLTRWSRAALAHLLGRAGLELVEIRVSSRLESLHALFCALAREAFYGVVGVREEFRAGALPAPEAAPSPVSPRMRRVLGRWGTAARLARDALLWLPTFVTAPLGVRFLEGYTLMAAGRRPVRRAG